MEVSVTLIHLGKDTICSQIRVSLPNNMNTISSFEITIVLAQNSIHFVIEAPSTHITVLSVGIQG